MISDLPVPKNNPILPGVEQNDKVKESKTDVNETDAGTLKITFGVFFAITNYYMNLFDL